MCKYFYDALYLALFSSVDTANVSYDTFLGAFSFSDKRPELLGTIRFHSNL